MKKTLVALATAVMVLATPTAAQAYGGNYYAEEGLDGYITGPTNFTLTPEGDTAVCAMSFNGTRLTSAPWTFTYDPDAPSKYVGGGGVVDIEHCDGSQDDWYVRASVPFTFDGRVVSGGKGYRNASTVVNNTNETATVTIADMAGAVISEGVIEPYGRFPVTLPKGKKTARYTVTAATASGLSMSSLFTKPDGWALLLDDATVPPCSVVTWAYDDTRAPKNTKTFRKDLLASFDVLSKETGLTFVETDDFDNAQLRYTWRNISSAGLGGTDGSVTFSTTSRWPRDQYAGFKPFKRHTVGNRTYTAGPAGRGWLIVHETMHALGFDHVDDEKSIMAPINRGQGEFTKGDLEGLHEMYLSRCPA